jgi:hypothetical protein
MMRTIMLKALAPHLLGGRIVRGRNTPMMNRRRRNKKTFSTLS